jgi:hypothetical protein
MMSEMLNMNKETIIEAFDMPQVSTKIVAEVPTRDRTMKDRNLH